MEYTQEQQDQILRKLNAGVVGKRKEGDWDRISKNTIWSKSLVIKESQKYKTLKEFFRNSNGAYNFAKRNGFLEEIESKLVSFKEKNFELKEIIKVIKQYNSPIKFSKDHPTKYSYLQRNNLLEEAYKHMTNKRIKWDWEKAFEVAKQYNNRNLFFKENQSAYQWLKKNNLYDKAVSHMTDIKRGKEWNKENIQFLAKQCKGKYDFAKKYNHAYNMARKLNILNEIFPKKETR